MRPSRCLCLTGRRAVKGRDSPLLFRCSRHNKWSVPKRGGHLVVIFESIPFKLMPATATLLSADRRAAVLHTRAYSNRILLWSRVLRRPAGLKPHLQRAKVNCHPIASSRASRPAALSPRARRLVGAVTQAEGCISLLNPPLQCIATMPLTVRQLCD